MSSTQTTIPSVRLGDLLIDSCYGTSAPSSPDGATTVLGITNIRGGRVRPDGAGRISLPDSERAKLALRLGDILLMRTNSPDLVGQTALIESDTDAIFASYLVRLRVDTERVIPSYLNYWMNGPDGRRQIQRIVTRAVGQANVNPTQLRRSVHVPLPPLEDQEHAAGVLSTWDSAIDKIEQILKAKRIEMVGSFTAAVAASGGSHAGLGDICAVSKGSGLSKDDLRPDGTYPCILYGELHTTYGEVVAEVRSRTDEFTPTSSRRGDVLIPSSSETSEAFANATALNQDDVLLGGDISILRPRRPGVYDSEYLAYYLTHTKRREIARLAQGNSIVHLYGRDIAHLGVTLPDMERQRRVATALAYGRREITALEGVLDRYLTQRRGVAQALFGRTTPAVEARVGGRES